ncbi:hypothetical protein SCOCK_30127 [Actinacidiphila cocklensis]|uniref:Uncharacterized protein n=1 Tax=Actinacidiphila cocklensis TaxID=887465 RepID=A0A9W4GRZ2_9ACTN|nr:hypothetical protein SCOCK_30127 [Actinacidiphila cocklensis]
MGHPAAGRLRLQRPVVGRVRPHATARRRALRRHRGTDHRPRGHRRGRGSLPAGRLAHRRRLRADRPGGDHSAPAGGGHRRRVGLAGEVSRAHPRRGQDRHGPEHAGGARRRHSGHPRFPQPGRAAYQPGRPAGPRPPAAPLRPLGRPQRRRVPLRPVDAAGTAYAQPAQLPADAGESRKAQTLTDGVGKGGGLHRLRRPPAAGSNSCSSNPLGG